MRTFMTFVVLVIAALFSGYCSGHPSNASEAHTNLTASNLSQGDGPPRSGQQFSLKVKGAHGLPLYVAPGGVLSHAARDFCYTLSHDLELRFTSQSQPIYICTEKTDKLPVFQFPSVSDHTCNSSSGKFIIIKSNGRNVLAWKDPHTQQPSQSAVCLVGVDTLVLVINKGPYPPPRCYSAEIEIYLEK